MGMGINEETFSIDTSGIREYYTTHVLIENAGGGLIRIIGCVSRNGQNVPVYSSVRPAVSFLKTEAELLAFARRIVMESTEMTAAH